jgi:tetratricopeptide (TPR) repeat protein
MVGRAIVEANMDEVDVYVDGELKGRVEPGKPLILPGLTAGPHEFKGVRNGYQPDTKEIVIAPGQDATVTLRIRYARVIKKSALDLNDQGEQLLFTRRSTINPLNIVQMNRSQSDNDLQKALDFFNRALADDPQYALAAYHIGQTYQLLGDQEKSIAAFRQALTIDPSYVEARLGLGGVLLESGDADAAVRDLNEAMRLDPDNDQLYSLLARALWEKNAWQQSIDYAGKALDLNPSNAAAHLWRADSLRHLADEEKADPQRRLRLFREARDHYHEFINQTNFESSLASRLAYHFVGYGIGSRTHADRQASYTAQRLGAFLGLCITEQRVGLLKRAREYCGRALEYDENSPVAHYVLANVYRDMFNESPSCDDIADARRHYQTVIKLNPDLDEAKRSRTVLASLEGVAKEMKCRGA